MHTQIRAYQKARSDTRHVDFEQMMQFLRTDERTNTDKLNQFIQQYYQVSTFNFGFI